MQVKSKHLTLILIIFGVFFTINSGLAETTCAQKYQGYGQCAPDCTALGADYQKDTETAGLCVTGSCCYKTGGSVTGNDSIAGQINLQIPIFEKATISNLPEYIATLYRYILILLVPLAIIMIIVGGVSWIAAAGNQGKIESAKKYITAAFSGLIIGLFSYVLLSLVGIDALTMPGIETIKPIEGVPLEIFNQIMSGAGLTPSSTDPAACQAMAEQVAKENGIHPCFFVAILAKESGCKANAVGHDENAPNSPAHRAFGGSKNTDKICATPPNFCLDWRYSHGFGISQYTIGGTVATKFPWCAAGTPSRKESWIRGGACITVAQIFDIKTALGIMSDYVKHFNGPSNPRAFFKAYNGADVYADSAMKIFQKCCSERGGC
jgi:hypothetical protein